MDFLIFSLILLGLALMAAMVLIVVKMRKRQVDEMKEVNYQSFLVMGISFVGMGTALTATINAGFIGITVLGIIYMLIGLKNRGKWMKSQTEI